MRLKRRLQFAHELLHNGIAVWFMITWNVFFSAHMRISRRQKSSLLFSQLCNQKLLFISLWSFSILLPSSQKKGKKKIKVFALRHLLSLFTWKTEIEEIGGSKSCFRKHDFTLVSVGNSFRHLLGVHYQIIYFVISLDNSQHSVLFNLTSFFCRSEKS